MDPYSQSDYGIRQEKRQNASKKMRVRLPVFGRKSSSNDVEDDDDLVGREYSRNTMQRKSPKGLRARSGSNDSSPHLGYGTSNGVGQHHEHNTDADYGQEGDVNKKIRVKPSSAFPSATYMNEIELYQCMMAGSSKFEFLSSYMDPSTKATRRFKVPDIVRRQFGSPKEDGRVGSLRIEILGCVGLDRAKPEVSVYAVCGDCAFSTDIIDGNRSPMWPNSSKRAAVFPLHHAYARVFIGVFDVKQQKEREADHLCGRVAIDIPSLRPNTEYDITFPLRVSAFIYDRRPRGVVRVRFSIHWFSERSAILSYLKRPRNPLAFSKQAKKIPYYSLWRPKNISQRCRHSPWPRLSREIHSWSVSSYNARIQFIATKHSVSHESSYPRLHLIRESTDVYLFIFDVDILRLSELCSSRATFFRWLADLSPCREQYLF